MITLCSRILPSAVPFRARHAAAQSFHHAANFIPAICILFFAAFCAAAPAQTNLGSISVGSSSASTAVTVAIPSAAAVTGISVVAQGAPDLDFNNAGGGTCALGKAYTAGSTCTVNVAFTPVVAGTRYGAVVLEGAGGVVGLSYLIGAGQAPQSTFLPASPSTIGTGFASPEAVAVDGNGNVFIVDGVVYMETFAGGGYTQTTIGSNMQQPRDVAVDGAGNVYVADSAAKTIFKETLANGQYTQFTIVTGLAAPSSLAVDASGNLYIVDNPKTGPVVYKETLANRVYTQSTIASGIAHPVCVAVDGAGSVYVADSATGNIYKETPASDSSYTQSTVAAGFAAPVGLAVDGSGNVYVSDTALQGVVKEAFVNSQYTASTIASGFAEPQGVAVDMEGNVYVADTANHVVDQENLYYPPVLSFGSTAVATTSSSSPEIVTITNIGNQALAFTAIGYPRDFPEALNATGDCAATAPLAAGASCTLSIDFAPLGVNDTSASLSLNEAVSVTGNSLNLKGTQQQIAVFGTETKTATFTSLTASPNPAQPGATVTLKATVAVIGVGSVPAGLVTFYLGAVPLGSVAPASGVTTLAVSTLKSGSSSLTAAFTTSSASYAGSSSSPLVVTVVSTPKLTLASSAPTAKLGTAVKFTARVTGTGSLPTGIVTFYSGTVKLGSVSLIAGSASFSETNFLVGAHAISAKYAGSASYNPASSAALTETIQKVVPKITLATSARTAFVDGTVKFTAAVAAVAGIAPTGKVAFYSGTTLIGSEVLAAGKAVFSTQALTAGTHSITARFGGNANYLTAASTAIVETIDKLAPKVSLRTSANPAQVGSKVTFTVTVTGSATIPAGTIVFKSGITALGTVTLVAGKAVLTTAKLAAGTASITATYSGNPVYNTASSSILKEIIQAK